MNLFRNRQPYRFHQALVSRQVGGAGMVALNLSKYLVAQGRTALAWVPGAGAASQACESESIPFRSFRLDQMQHGTFLHAVHCLGMARRLRSDGASLVHVHNPTLFGIVCPALRLAGLPTIAHVQIEPTQAEIDWAFKRLPDVIITCAGFLVETVRTMLGQRAERTTIVSVPNAVDLAKFSPGDRAAAKRKLGAPPNRPLLLMLANLAPHKGQETAIKAVAHLKGRGTDVDCWLAGEERDTGGEYTARLRALIENLGVSDRVRMLGFRQDGPELLRGADMLLLPSTREGLPLTVLEAQAASVPVLAAPTAGIPEAVADGQTGFLIAADDADAYAAQIARLVENPGYAAAIADRARRHVENKFSWGAFCARTVEIYDELLRRRSGSPN